MPTAAKSLKFRSLRPMKWSRHYARDGSRVLIAYKKAKLTMLGSHPCVGSWWMIFTKGEMVSRETIPDQVFQQLWARSRKPNPQQITDFAQADVEEVGSCRFQDGPHEIIYLPMGKQDGTNLITVLLRENQKARMCVIHDEEMHHVMDMSEAHFQSLWNQATYDEDLFNAYLFGTTGLDPNIHYWGNPNWQNPPTA